MAKEEDKAGREARDPSSRCGECAHRRTRRMPDGFNGFYCGCWNVRGGDGTGYRRVSLKDPACRHFVPRCL